MTQPGTQYLANLKAAKEAADKLHMDMDVPFTIMSAATDFAFLLEQEIFQHSLRLSVRSPYKIEGTETGRIPAPCADCQHPHHLHVDGGACADPKCWCGEYKVRMIVGPSPAEMRREEEHLEAMRKFGAMVDEAHPDPERETLHMRPDE